jgi:hypothetical protein
MPEIKYGRVERESKIDGVGSKMIQSATLHNGNETDVKTRFEIRVRVTSEKDVLTEFLRFRVETKDMAKAEFRIEHTAIGNQQGFFYVVKCWTEVGR